MARQFRDIISADFLTNKFNTLKVTNVLCVHGLTQIFYDDCISPIELTEEEYETLCLDHIVELHQGEIAIRWA